MKELVSGAALALRSWGLWPCTVMVLCQWQASDLSGGEPSPTITLLTVSGTLAMYGCDRHLERRLLRCTASRHHAPLAADILFMFITIVAAALAIPQVTGREWTWLLILAGSGALYLAMTSNLIRAFPMAKEITGSFCFTLLVWGMFPRAVPANVLFFLMALSNFLWSAHQDRVRDAKNELRSLAVTAPAFNLLLARLLAALAAAGFLATATLRSPFFWVSFAHALWPSAKRTHIDLAFLPLVVVFYRGVFGN